MSKILVTGGAGYIGSITNQLLKKNGYKTVVFDSMRHNRSWALEGTRVIKGNLLNKKTIESALVEEKVDAVIHFAAYIEAGESMKDPEKYYRNNVVGTLNLLRAMQKTNVNNLVFSSTAAVYGTPKATPITEDFEKHPENTYGETKLAVEGMLKWFQTAHELNYVALRYFNASGATSDCSLGEAHDPETHIIPIFLKKILEGKDFAINGSDYNTPDGTCIRDYIHVQDLASAHAKALEVLLQNKIEKINTAYNVGTGKGYSNKEIADTIIKITQTKNTYSIGPRRPGDPDILVADSTKIQQKLNWSPQYSDLNTIIETAWNWHKKHS